MPMNYKQYQEEVTADVAKVLRDAECQPILFVGSGFSKRYGKGPNWEELLTALAKKCPLIDKDFAYYKQAQKGDLKKIGSVFTDLYREWAWGKGKSEFPAEYFSATAPADIFIKHMIAELLKNLGPNAKGSYGSKDLDAEIEALKNISAHAIITTNYDQMLDPLFPEYEPIIGQQIMRKGYLAIGEIFKIHGCCTIPQSIVVNEADYQRFDEDHKYLSAKLLTYFIEHPLIFIGYRADDPNIKAILYDVYRMVRASTADIVPNIYILQWDPSITDDSNPAREYVISVAPDINIRIKSITANSFEWVFKAFGQAGNLEKINTKLLRALMARSVELIRSDIPKKYVEINFQQLEHAVESGENFAKLFGVTSLADPSKVNLDYKYTISGVAQQLGFTYWYPVRVMISKIAEETGFDITATDNKYHIAYKIGHKSDQLTHKYTEAAVQLFRRYQKSEPLQLDTGAVDVDKTSVAAAVAKA
ncbi:SIR2 family protein [Azohydromonas caseinilytica]|uniref:SIR2 family protein n=1 Tax=Azohydromonas caseinilytica TaxID=2728836 RepID=A0A848F732_9BURK|nr:SIR2 family protein [Azohydromonas caseinilytica]NML14369.1 SIR2 family protein [Azohydromonas caseinilytica]